LDKNARLTDIKLTTDKPLQPEKKQRVSGAFSNSFTPSEKVKSDGRHCAVATLDAGADVVVLLGCMQELYERLVEAERQRAEAEKARGDDLREIALRLASGKKGE
jgi:hypothetical protein